MKKMALIVGAFVVVAGTYWIANSDREPESPVIPVASTVPEEAETRIDPVVKSEDSLDEDENQAIRDEVAVLLGLPLETVPEEEIKPIASSDIPETNGMHFFILASELFPADVDLAWIDQMWDEILEHGWDGNPEVALFLESIIPSLEAI